MAQRPITIVGDVAPAYETILTSGALEFIVGLHERFESRRQELLAQRAELQLQLDDGWLPGFVSETAHVRESAWSVAPIPNDLEDRRVEITGPVDRKMVINALNSGANVFMADFEDSHAPTWANTMEGHINLRDAVRRTITFESDAGKRYALAEDTATLFVRPRGWHLSEKHLRVGEQPVSASLVDFGLYLYHNAAHLLAHRTGPYFYLPKLEHYLEARLWNDVFLFAQDELGMPRGTIRATVLIENILVAFQMDEILWELREHSAGLNCGRWDYIFSVIKKFRERPDFVLPDRARVTMEQPFMSAYVELLIQTCHRRGIHAMGGMAAQIPIKSDPDANALAIQKVHDDKMREVIAGHDGTWVAHPGLVALAREVFDTHMATPNQIHRKREDITVTAAELLNVPAGSITEDGLRHNVDVGIQYLEAWLRGSGCVPIYHLMEDAATAEISRSQVWQWIRHGVKLDDDTPVTPELVQRIIEQEKERLSSEWGEGRTAASCLEPAAAIFERMMLSDAFTEWMTAAAYEHL